jgi:predicted nucleic acid-binding Zn ribbon protein
MHDDTSESRTQSPKAEPPPRPTEAELSRIAREAVHQPPDVRLDKQLVRMGLMDPAELAGPQPARPASRPVAIDEELERLSEELRRTRVILWLLVGVTALLVVVVVVLLLR